MVEVWLPYADTELPLELPDPIDLRIVPRRINPTSEYNKVLSEFKNEILNHLNEPIKIYLDPFMMEPEKEIIFKIFDDCNLRYEYVTHNPDIVVNIIRHDPILGVKSSLISLYLMENYNEAFNSILNSDLKLEGSIPNIESLKNRIRSDNVYFLDIVLDGNYKPIKYFISKDFNEHHNSNLLSTYEDIWGLKVDISKMIIASIGGSPWDVSLRGIISSLIKLALISDTEGLSILIGDGKITEADADDLLLYNKSIDNVNRLYLYMLKKYMSSAKKRIYYFGSIPSTMLRKFGIKEIRDIDKFIKTTPLKYKRSITVIESISLVNMLKSRR